MRECKVDVHDSYLKKITFLYSKEDLGFLEKRKYKKQRRKEDEGRIEIPLRQIEYAEYKTIYQYLKEERPNDIKYNQAMLGGLSKKFMQKYFQERNADPEFQLQITAQTNNETSQNAPYTLTGKELKVGYQTTDVFGKDLKYFKKRSDLEDEDPPPLIFWLLAGYFRSKPERFKELGLFRVTSAGPDVRELEVHLSQGNYGFLNKVKSSHIVANYWKRLFREMRNPLIPFEHYYQYGELASMSEIQKIKRIKELID